MNPNLSTPALWIAGFTTVLIVIVVVRQIAAARHGLLAFTKVHTAKALLAGIYLIGFLVLLFTDVRQGPWSAALLPVGMAAWVVAWWIDAEVSIYEHRRSRRQVRAVLEDGDRCGDS